MVNKKFEVQNPQFLTTAQAAEILGISRISVHHKITKGEIPAQRIGRNYIIPVVSLFGVRKRGMTSAEKKQIAEAVRKVIKDFSEALKLLGKE